MSSSAIFLQMFVIVVEIAVAVFDHQFQLLAEHAAIGIEQFGGQKGTVLGRHIDRLVGAGKVIWAPDDDLSRVLGEDRRRFSDRHHRSDHRRGHTQCRSPSQDLAAADPLRDRILHQSGHRVLVCTLCHVLLLSGIFPLSVSQARHVCAHMGKFRWND